MKTSLFVAVRIRCVLFRLYKKPVSSHTYVCLMYSFIWSISQNGRFALKKEKKLRVLSCYCWAITGRQRRRHVSCYQSLPQFSPPTLPAPPPFWHLSHVRQITSAGFEFFSRCCFCFRQKGNALRRLSRLKWHAHTHTDTHTHALGHSHTQTITRMTGKARTMRMRA